MLPLRINHKERLKKILTSFLLALLAIFLIIVSSYKHIHVYRSVDEFYESPVLQHRLRLGGIIQKGSVHHQNGNVWTFRIGNDEMFIEVHYQGALPLLFKEGQETLVEGIYDGKFFQGERILIKHDERYSPKPQKGA
jgi:cytochrome c-type biogenesis protein CcmE